MGVAKSVNKLTPVENPQHCVSALWERNGEGCLCLFFSFLVVGSRKLKLFVCVELLQDKNADEYEPWKSKANGRPKRPECSWWWPNTWKPQLFLTKRKAAGLAVCDRRTRTAQTLPRRIISPTPTPPSSLPFPFPFPTTPDSAKMTSPKYTLVALPATIVRSGDPEEALHVLRSTVSPDAGEISRFPIPSFKIGTLDALVLQADELAKVDQQVEAAVAKAADVLRNVCEAGQEHKTVNDSKYSSSFSSSSSSSSSSS